MVACNILYNSMTGVKPFPSLMIHTCTCMHTVLPSTLDTCECPSIKVGAGSPSNAGGNSTVIAVVTVLIVLLLLAIIVLVVGCVLVYSKKGALRKAESTSYCSSRGSLPRCGSRGSCRSQGSTQSGHSYKSEHSHSR